MSSDRAILLAQRRSALRARCAVQRTHLADTTEHIEARLGGVDRGIEAVRRLAGHPLLIVGGVALLTLVGPRRLVRLAGRSAVLLTAGQRIMRLMR
jgi:hypothetical protein